MPQLQLSPLFDDADIANLVQSLTGTDVRLDLDGILDPLGLPYQVVDPIKTDIWEAFNAAVGAAFAAGLAAGLEPSRLLLSGREVQS